MRGGARGKIEIADNDDVTVPLEPFGFGCMGGVEFDEAADAFPTVWLGARAVVPNPCDRPELDAFGRWRAPELSAGEETTKHACRVREEAGRWQAVEGGMLALVEVSPLVEAWSSYRSAEELEEDRRRWESRGWRLADVTETEVAAGILARLRGKRARLLHARYVREGWPVDEWR